MILTIHGSGNARAKLKNDDSSLVEVFDSLGEQTYNDEMTTFMTKFKHCIVHSKYLSGTDCGYYALLYAYYRSRKYSPRYILNILREMSDVKRHCLLLFKTFNEFDFK